MYCVGVFIDIFHVVTIVFYYVLFCYVLFCFSRGRREQILKRADEKEEK